MTNRPLSHEDARFQGADEKRPVTIVGIGNEYRGDDGVALLVLRQLEKSLRDKVRLIQLTGDQTELLDLMQETDRLIIVDAVSSSAPAGTIFQINASKELFPSNFFTVSSHSIDIAKTIELAKAINCLPEFVLIYGIVGKDFSFTESLSPEARESAEIVRDKILVEFDRMTESEAAG